MLFKDNPFVIRLLTLVIKKNSDILLPEFFYRTKNFLI